MIMVTQAYSKSWDLLVDNSNGQPILIVEVKSKTNTSSEWAAKLRRNILAHEILPKVPYFLLVFPDKFYLWVNNTEVNLTEEKPDYTIDANPILQPYFKRIGIQDNHIRQQSLELIIASWLNELIYSEETDEKQSQSWLIESGLYDALRGGKVNYGETM
ncbi:MAG: hypothetical protein ACRC2S_12320 [Waterburya sp.]